MNKRKLERILYVEDDKTIAEVTMMTFEEFSQFNVKHCPSGQAALEIVDQYQPHLLLIDVMMPEMDGVTTVKKMREKKLWTNLPVIFMTAKAQTHEQSEYVSIGAIGDNVKPFDTMQLGQNIEK